MCVPPLPPAFARHTQTPPSQQFVQVVVRIGQVDGSRATHDDALAFTHTSPDTITVKTSYADDQRSYR